MTYGEILRIKHWLNDDISHIFDEFLPLSMEGYLKLQLQSV